MCGSEWCRQAHLADAKLLSEVMRDKLPQGTRNWWLQYLRELTRICSETLLLGRDGKEPQAAAEIMLAGIQIIDSASSRAVLHVIFSGDQPDHIFLNKLLNYCFYKQNLYRLEILLPTAAANKATAVYEQMGWQQEGILTKALYDPQKCIHNDVMMYTLLRPQYKGRGTAFVLFPRGMFTILGTDMSLLETGFAHFRQRLAAPWQEAAELLGLLDGQGYLKNDEDLSALLPEGGYWAMPELPLMVRTAAGQAIEYFTGERQSFDLRYDLDGGSPFQVKVWQALAAIPFGATWSYEEMAEYIIEEGNTCQEPRKLARAVGSACAANPLPLFLPCHRIIGKDGKLTGFSGGLDIKEYLLEYEMFRF